MSTMTRDLRLPGLLAALLLQAQVAATSTGPSTPTFVLAWGNHGSAPSQFDIPTGVTTDALGDVYVVEYSNNRVQKFDRLGRFILQWGTGGAGNGEFNHPFGLAADAAGFIYVVDSSNNRIQKFTGDSTYIGQWGGYGNGNGQFAYPIGVASDVAGNIYVADFGNHRIQKFTGAGTYLTQWGTFGTGNGELNEPVGVATDAAGNVYVTEYGNNRIQKFTRAGAYVATWGAYGTGAGQFDGPTGVATDAVGNVYVTDQHNHRIQKFTGTGTFLTQWGSNGTGNGQFNYPTGVNVDAGGNVYVAEDGGDRIQKFSGAGIGVSEAPAAFLLQAGTGGFGNGQFNRPFGVATDATGNFYVADQDNHRIQKFSATGAYLTQWGGYGLENGQFTYPQGIAVDAEGDVYVVDSNNCRVQKFAADGSYLTQWGHPGNGIGDFLLPSGVATDAAGDVYVADRNNHRVQKFTSTGDYLTKWGGPGSGIGQFFNPTGVATDDAGNVYVADRDNRRVQKFTSTGGYITQWGGIGSGNGQFTNPVGVATDAAGNVYVADESNGGILENHRIQKFTGTGTFLTAWGGYGIGNGQFHSPTGVATDVAGNVYVVDQGNARIQKFVIPPAIALVSDVGSDQGRQVKIRFLRSSADTPGPGGSLRGYDIYRRNDPLPSLADVVSSASAAATSNVSLPTSIELAGWTYLSTVLAYGESGYDVVVPTQFDATASSLAFTAFMVRATTSNASTYYDSGAEYGWSVDNLAPPAPAPFTANYAGGATHLTWGPSPATDFASFRLHRGVSADFVPDLGNLVTATPDTGYADVGPAGSYYKVSAVDRNGNASPFTSLGPGQTTDVTQTGPLELALEGARPNPSRGSRMLVQFVLPNDAPARLELFDLTGRRVADRAVGALGPGRHAVDLASGRRLPAGLYLIRLTQDARDRSLRSVHLD